MTTINELVGIAGDGYQRFDNTLMINNVHSSDISK